MDGQTLLSRFALGLARGAARTGLACQHWRPISAQTPALDPSAALGAVIARLVAEGASADRPPSETQLNYAYFTDPSAIQPGDYLQRQADGAIFFVSSLSPLSPPAAIRCTAAMSVTRSAAGPGIATSTGSAAGLGGYGAGSASGPARLLNAFPAGLRITNGVGLGDAKLPDSARLAGVEIFLPPLPADAVGFQAGDIFADDLNRRFRMDSIEVLPGGLRILAKEARL